MDIFRSPNKVDHIGKRIVLPVPPSMKGASEQERKDQLYAKQSDFPFPPYLIVQFQAAAYAPSMFSSVYDGENYSLIFYFTLTGDLRRNMIKSLPTSNAAQFYKAFAEAGLESTKTSYKGRLKGIPKVLNLDDLDLGAVVLSTLKSYNGTPFLTGPVHQRWYQGANYLEVDVDVHEYCYMARKAANAALPSFPKMSLEMAFVIEARTDEELPEVCLGTVQFDSVDLHNAPMLDSLYNDHVKT